jgi:hypothetical protein
VAETAAAVVEIAIKSTVVRLVLVRQRKRRRNQKTDPLPRSVQKL